MTPNRKSDDLNLWKSTNFSIYIKYIQYGLFNIGPEKGNCHPGVDMINGIYELRGLKEADTGYS